MRSKYLITVDPGKRESAGAIFKDGRLVGLEHVSTSSGGTILPEFRTGVALSYALQDNLEEGATVHLIIEEMVTRRGRRDAHRNLMQLSRMTGALAGHFQAGKITLNRAGLIAPALWTGGLSKNLHQARTEGSLTGEERELMRSRRLLSNSEALDAVGIGLYQLGRV